MQTDITCSGFDNDAVATFASTESDNPISRLRRRLEACGIPSEAMTHLRPEIDGLSNSTARKTIEYYHCLADLPWRSGDAETVDVQCAQRLLDDGHFGLAGPKTRILEYLAVRHRTRAARGAVLCLVGPPGVGKTSLAASIAEVIGRKFAEISCNSLRESADVHGARRDYAASKPGQIMQQLRSVGVKNPVFVLDEIDKVSPAGANALLDALDPMQNDRFHDLYVGVPFDLSAAFFVATANVMDEIPTTLRNRLEVIEIAGYSEADKLQIAKRFLVPARMRDHGLTGDQIEFDDEALRTMIRDHASEMGVRDLDRSVSAICRRAVLELETSSGRTPPKVTVNKSMVGEVLGTQTGHDGGLPGVERLRAMIERGGSLPPEAGRHAKNELELMLSRSPHESDYQDRLTYLRCLARLPWYARDEERIDLRRTAELLDERHWGLTKAKRRILEYLAVRKLGAGKGALLCLVGPPGVGKTSLARSIATAIGRKFVAFSCAGLSDGTELRGHNRTWRGAQPGRLLRELVKTGAKNPVLMLDEIDKISRFGNSGGDPESALLEVLDPTQNDKFVDNYVEVPFDLSEVFFVATANDRDKISIPLQDRLEVIELPGYSEDEKFEIAAAHLVGRQLAENGLMAAPVRFTDRALHALIRGYTREAGVRDLERRIGAVCRQVAFRWAEGDESPTEITERTVADMLGAPPHADEVLPARMRRGVALGLSWTPVGGNVLFVEARRMRGDGRLTLTGQLGEVMKESARAALSWLRANAERYGVDPGFYETAEVHLHVPAGGIPKDGPSAGVAIAAALVSELTGCTVRRDCAMTGEISLSGDVLPVGGVKEKVLAARRLGIAEVILPKRNAKDVTKNLGDGLGLRYVSTLDEALELVLSRPRTRGSIESRFQS